MSREELLYAAVTELPDDLIAQGAKKSHASLFRYGSLAAALCLVISLSVFAGTRLFSRECGAGGGGHADGSSVFLSYAGPVFPLTLSDASETVTAQRSLTFDFAPFEPKTLEDTDGNGETFSYESFSTDCLLTDSYTLRSSAPEDQTVTVVYPFVSSFHDLASPTLTVDGVQQEGTLFFGVYAGGFTGVLGGGEDGAWNLAPPASWEQYDRLLADGAYLEQAFSEFPDLTQKVTVYEFQNAEAPMVTEGAPTYTISFQIDPEKTKVLTYNIGGMEWDAEAGAYRYSFFVPEAGSPKQGPVLLAVLGDDLSAYETAGYTDGGCETELPGVTAKITRRETTLSQLMRSLVADSSASLAFQYGDDVPEEGTEQMLTRAASELLCSYGVLSDNPAERYDSGRLDEIISEAYSQKRVFYLQKTVTIPAGGTTQIDLTLRKEASFDYVCADTENQGVYGFDAVTRLGSNLTFTDQTATLLSRGFVTLVRQNFGFDLETGITTVSLSPDEPHYYLEVRRAQ